MPILITRQQLAILVPRPTNPARAAVWDGYVGAITTSGDLLEQFGITSNLRWCHLIATWCGETNLTILWEDMSYSAQRILEVFHDKGIHTQEEAATLAHNPYALAERVYGLGCPRMAHMLGNTAEGDGFKYRGCGIEQITGRAAHEAYAGKIGCPIDQLSEPRNAIHAALLEWQEKRCNEKADRDDVVAVRRAINGGTNGLSDVEAHLARAKRIWPPHLTEVAGVMVPSVPAPSIELTDELTLGARGASVVEVQRLLKKAGVLSGPADGQFGTQTARAMTAFQGTHGLPRTGKVDAKTMDALRDAAEVQSLAAPVVSARADSADVSDNPPTVAAMPQGTQSPEPEPAKASMWPTFENLSFTRVNDLADQGSRLADSIKTFKNWFWGGTTLGGGGLAIANQFVDTSQGNGGAISHLASQHPFLLFLGGVLLTGGLAYVGVKFGIERGLISAHKDGRYLPRGAGQSLSASSPFLPSKVS